MRRVLALAALFAACALPLTASPDPALLDVIVESAGRQTPLTAADFTVSDALGPLTVEALELHNPEDGPGDEGIAAHGGGGARVVAIFIDEFHLHESGDLASVRAVLARFVRSSLGPRDLLVVLKPLDSLTSIRVSADREEAARTIESARGRLGDYAPRTPFEQQFLAGTPQRMDEMRAQISLSALSALTAHVGRLPGARKTLIAVSDGFTVLREPRRSAAPGFDDVGRTATIGRVAVYSLHATAFDQARSNSADTPSGDGDEGGRARLRRLSEQTTGFTIVAGSRLSDDLGRVLRDASRYYVLKVRSRAGIDDGAFRAVTVSVDRQGAIVRARGGYSVAPLPGAATRPLRPAAPLNVLRRTSPMIRPWFGLSSAADDRTRVSFVWEPAARVPGVGARRTDPETVSVQVTTLTGDPVFSGRIGAASAAVVVPTGQVSRLSFDADVGHFLVQMEIFDAAGRLLDRDVRDLVVKRFQTPVALGTPEVLRARTPRELRPLLDGGAGVPTVSREFSRADRLVIRVPLIGDVSDVRATLVSGFGASMRELSVTRLVTDSRVAQVDLTLAGLASGSYVVQLNASNAQGHAADRLAFAVRP